MYAQATIHTVVKTSVESGTHAVRLLGAFEKIYAPIFAALHEFLLELGGGRMLTPEELVPILDRLRGELPVESAHIEDGAVAKDCADSAAAKEMRGRFEHVLSNLQRLLNWKDLERANGGVRVLLAPAHQPHKERARGQRRVKSIAARHQHVR